MSIPTVLYRRVSTKKQEREGHSLPEQLYLAQQYASRNGLKIVADFMEPESGFDESRPKLEEMLQFLERGGAEVLLVLDMDRLTREPAHNMLLRKKLEGIGITIHTVNSGLVDNPFYADLMAVIKGQEVREQQQRLHNGRSSKARQGMIIGNGTPPYGYRRKEGARKRFELEIYAPEAEVIRLMYRLYLYGDNGQPVPVREMARRFTELGIPSPQARLSYAHHKAVSNGAWGRETIHRLLRHPVYKGTFPHLRNRVVKGKKQKDRRPEDWIYVPCPAIVEPELWERAQLKLNIGREQAARNTKHTYLLGRRISCICGYKRTGRGTTSRKARGETYLDKRYYCYTAQTGAAESIKCHNASIPAEELDAAVWSHLYGFIAHMDKLQEELNLVRIKGQGERANLIRDKALLEERRDKTRAQVRKLRDMYLEDEEQFEPGEYESRKKQYADILKAQEEGIEKLKERIEATGPTEEEISDFIALGRAIGQELTLGEEPSFEQKRRVVEFLDVRVVAGWVSREEALPYLEEEVDWSGLPDKLKVVHISTRLSPQKLSIVIDILSNPSHNSSGIDQDGAGIYKPSKNNIKGSEPDDIVRQLV